GVMRMIDQGEADDKIIAVMVDDPLYANVSTLNDMPSALVDRLRHYFLTYKEIASEKAPIIEIGAVYERDTAYKVIQAAIEDYDTDFRGQ
ncbi:MAG TPA: inorganic diphosphatase, partial [Turneriella sp.]|nr:inorganic diphosphatase [Turneriella sp.]